MTDREQLNNDLMQAYARLTPENKKKFKAKFDELLAEQRAQEENYLYFFDCLDADIGEKYLTARRVTDLVIGTEAETLTEPQIIKVAASYEATLYRFTKTNQGGAENRVCIYDCYAM